MGFWKQNAWKVALLSVLLLAAGFFTYRNCGRDEFARPDTLAFVCVTTGKVYPLPRGEKVRTVPCENPETHTLTLVPCIERDGGVFVPSRYRGTLKEMKEQNKAVDTNTLQVQVAK
jgi:hypothetical protein